MRATAHKVASRLAQLLGPVSGAAEPRYSTSIPEITPCVPRLDGREDVRLNILLPSINAAHYFGGIHTAVLLYRSLCRHFPLSRIVLLDAAPDAEALSRFGDHALVSCDGESDAPRQIVAFNDRYGRTLPVGPGDHWLATAWWTAYAAQRFAAWQEQVDGQARSISYLVQDFEPGFYSWSSQSALALSTYRPSVDLAIFNTLLLADYFRSQGLGYDRQFVFEPTLNEGLRIAQTQANVDAVPRARRIVVYGRPSTPRNAFELICEGLRCWGATDTRAAAWEVVAPGELTRDIDLGTLKLKALGKLDIGSYAELLSTSAIGLSLMVSPHPSYPPLEMAAFGMGVLSNRYANKDLGAFSPNVRSLPETTPESIARGLSIECDAWEARAMMPAKIMGADNPFLAGDSIEGVANQVAANLLSRQSMLA